MRSLLLIGFVAAGLSSVAFAQPVRPGMWRTTSTITAVDMPGAPPQVAAMMKGRPTTITQCVTPEQAAKDPRALMQVDKSCKVQSYSMAGGKMSATMVCQQRGGTVTVASAGAYTPTSATATSRISMSGASPMKMTASVSSRLIGPCT